MGLSSEPLDSDLKLWRNSSHTKPFSSVLEEQFTYRAIQFNFKALEDHSGSNPETFISVLKLYRNSSHPEPLDSALNI